MVASQCKLFALIIVIFACFQSSAVHGLTSVGAEKVQGFSETSNSVKTNFWQIQYHLAGNLQEKQESNTSIFPIQREERVVSFQHLRNTIYVKNFDMISEESESVLIHHFAIIFCKDLGEGFTVNQDQIIEEGGNERQACKGLIAPFGEAWGSEPQHLNTSVAKGLGLQLPRDVGLMVGTKSNYKFAGVSVHYTVQGLVPRNAIRNSSVVLSVTNTPPKYYMGMIYANTYSTIPNNDLAFIIPGGQKEYTVGTSCVPTITKELYLFGYGTHTHHLGTSISIYGHSPMTNVTRRILLDKHPNGENKVEYFNKEIKLSPGEIVISTCTYDTTNSGDVKLGGTSNTEMCDFVLNFYTSSNDKDEHIINCSDGVISGSDEWEQILNTKGALVYH